MKYFVRPEANILILRHFQAESNLLNFVIDNSGKDGVAPVEIYQRNSRFNGTNICSSRSRHLDDHARFGTNGYFKLAD